MYCLHLYYFYSFLHQTLCAKGYRDKGIDFAISCFMFPFTSPRILSDFLNSLVYLLPSSDPGKLETLIDFTNWLTSSLLILPCNIYHSIQCIGFFVLYFCPCNQNSTCSQSVFSCFSSFATLPRFLQS